MTNLASTSVAGLQTFSMANALAQGQATLVPGDASGNALWMPGNHVVVHGSKINVYLIMLLIMVYCNYGGGTGRLVKRHMHSMKFTVLFIYFLFFYEKQSDKISVKKEKCSGMFWCVNVKRNWVRGG